MDNGRDERNFKPKSDLGPQFSDLGPQFNAVLAASLVTNLGDGLRLAALPLLGTTLTSSPLLISGITAAQFLPWTTFAPIGGVIVDRSDRRRLIMITQAWRAAVMLILGVAVVVDVVQIWHVFVVAFVITVGEILVDPSVVATVPTLVAAPDLDRANSRLSSVELVTNNFVGSPVGAATFALFPALPFLIDAGSYFASIAPFSRLPPSPKRAPTARESLRVEMAGGVKWIASHPFLRASTLGIAIFNIGTAGGFSLLILLVVDVLAAPEVAFGLVLATAAAGATIASLFAARLTDRFSRRSVMSVGAVVTALTVLGAAGTQATWQLLVAWALNGAASGVLLSIGRGFIQRHTPNDLLGRTAIASRMITRTSFVIGALIAGAIASATTVRWAFVVAGVLHLVGAALLWRSFNYETDPADGSDTPPPLSPYD